jgi:Protein of unknown function (DUF3035)
MKRPPVGFAGRAHAGRALAPAAALAAALALSGCGSSLSKTFGLTNSGPDEFDVGTYAPLSIPPELGSLPPPRPGAPPTQQVNAATVGRDALVPQSALTPSATAQSPGQEALLDQAGPTPPPGIRADVNTNAELATKSPGLVSQILGNANASNPNATVDASAEARRLQGNAAVGAPTTMGATPQTQDQNPGLIERFFNLF